MRGYDGDSGQRTPDFLRDARRRLCLHFRFGLLAKSLHALIHRGSSITRPPGRRIGFRLLNGTGSAMDFLRALCASLLGLPRRTLPLQTCSSKVKLCWEKRRSRFDQSDLVGGTSRCQRRVRRRHEHTIPLKRVQRRRNEEAFFAIPQLNRLYRLIGPSKGSRAAVTRSNGLHPFDVLQYLL